MTYKPQQPISSRVPNYLRRILPPPRPKSVKDYLSTSAQAQIVPEALTLASRLMVVENPNYFASGGYIANKNNPAAPGHVVLQKPSETIATHELIHALDYKNNMGLSKGLNLPEKYKRQVFRTYWSGQPQIPRVAVTGSYHASSRIPEQRREFWRQFSEGQPVHEQFATIGQFGPSRVPHYLRRLYSGVYKFPKLPRVLFTGD